MKLFSRFRKEREGSIMIETAVTLSLLGLGFIGLWTTTNSIRNANMAELAISDVVMTARTIPNIDDRSDDELITLFQSVALQTLRSDQNMDIMVERVCGCPLQSSYSKSVCSLDECGDGLVPARYLELDLTIGAVEGAFDGTKSLKDFSIQTSVQY